MEPIDFFADSATPLGILELTDDLGSIPESIITTSTPVPSNTKS